MSDLKSSLQKILDKFEEAIAAATTEEQIKEVHVAFLGRKAELNTISKSIKDLPKEERPQAGQDINKLRKSIEEKYEKAYEAIKSAALNEQIASAWTDVTKPTYTKFAGKKHPLSSMLERTLDIFSNMGFTVEFPNDIDTEFNNFTAVNIPENHPAKDMWDTFWTEDGNVAITHTSSMQHRVIKNSEPPIRVIVPGRCFRNEATDARHEHTFYQVEGIYIDKGINMSHMLGTLKAFFSEFFEQETNVLFTPDFFPFVEPGGMMSIDCSNLGEGFMKVSKGTGWLEVLGCGMVHPRVLEMAGLDPNVYSGFAWGFGLERLIMLKYGIDDVRLFHSGDLRFLNQFK